MLVFLLTFISPNADVTQLIYSNRVHQQMYISDSVCIDKVAVEEIENYGLNELDNLILFVKYIKTQSNHIDTELGKTDVYYVIQTMINRMRSNGVDWATYYKCQRINNSQSIQRMKNGSLKPGFNIDSKHDKEITMMVYAALYSQLPDKYRIDNDVLYFHSFGASYNRSPHSRNKLNVIARHRFYCK